jgi:hypothetical protein
MNLRLFSRTVESLVLLLNCYIYDSYELVFQWFFHFSLFLVPMDEFPCNLRVFYRSKPSLYGLVFFYMVVANRLHI